MAKAKFKISDAPSLLYRLGVDFYETGNLEYGGVQVFDYFKADRVSDEKKEEIRQACPDVLFLRASPSYAPEIQRQLICFPKAAYYKLTPAQREKVRSCK